MQKHNEEPDGGFLFREFTQRLHKLLGNKWSEIGRRMKRSENQVSSRTGLKSLPDGPSPK